MKNKIVSGILLILIIVISLAINQYANNIQEGLVMADRPIPKNENGIEVIPDGFYKVSDGQMAPVPYGYKATLDKLGIIPTTDSTINSMNDIDAQITDIQSKLDKLHPKPVDIYDKTKPISETNRPVVDPDKIERDKLNVKMDLLKAQKLNDGYASKPVDPKTKYSGKVGVEFNDVEYHDSVDKIKAETDMYGQIEGTVYVYDKSGNKIAMKPGKMQGNITYYQPNTYQFGASSYVPNYEDSVYLSRTTGLSQVGKIKYIPNYEDSIYLNKSTGLSHTAAYKPDTSLNGMCAYHKNNPEQLEEACQGTDVNKCGSMSCCVLLGGVKCVSGNETGPTQKRHYSDIYVKNRDYYYHQGKCYGNCP